MSGPYDVVVCQRYREPALYPALADVLAPGGPRDHGAERRRRHGRTIPRRTGRAARRVRRRARGHRPRRGRPARQACSPDRPPELGRRWPPRSPRVSVRRPAQSKRGEAGRSLARGPYSRRACDGTTVPGDDEGGIAAWGSCSSTERGPPRSTAVARNPLPGRRHASSPPSTRPAPRTRARRSPPRAAPSTTAPGRAPRRRARRPAAARRRPAGARPGRARPRRVPGHRQAAGGERVRHRRHRELLPLLRPPGAARRRAGSSTRAAPERRQPGGARAGRRLRADHAVELPAAADGLEGRARRSARATPSSSSPAS